MWLNFIIMGKYTSKGLGGFVSNPDTDRRAATTALCASAGAKPNKLCWLKR